MESFDPVLHHDCEEGLAKQIQFVCSGHVETLFINVIAERC